MSFEQFNLHPDVLKGIRDMRYETPTPIQEKVIGPILEGKDLIANAQTGSGKTAAFLLPLLSRFADRPQGTRALILVPTRELCVQIDENALGLGYNTKVKSAAIYGGVKMEMQERSLRAGTSIIVATPGRLLDHYKYDNWRFQDLEVLVLDEADRMLDMGFMPDLQAIIAKIPAKRQTLLFSATMPDPIAKLARTIMNDPVHIKVGEPRPPSSITQKFYTVSPLMKERLLMHILKADDMKSVIVFVSTKIGCDRLGRGLQRAGFKAGIIHGGREQEHRDEVLQDFKNGTLQVLVATDVAARGVDIDGVSHVINFDVPWDSDTYVHRIGRTARAENIGDAFTFVTPGDEEAAADVEKRVGMQIPRVAIEGFQPRPGEPSEAPHRGPGGGRGREHGGRGHGGGGGSPGRGGPSRGGQGGHRPGGQGGRGPGGHRGGQGGGRHPSGGHQGHGHHGR